MKTLNVNKDFDKIITSIGVIGADLLKHYMHKYGYMKLDEGIYLREVKDDSRVLRVTYPDGNWFNVVKNYSVGTRCNWKYVAEQVRQIMCRHYNVPTPDCFETFNDWANDLYENGFCNSEKRIALAIKEFGIVNMAELDDAICRNS